MKRCFLLSLSNFLLKKSLKIICCSNTNHLFYKSKTKNGSTRHNSILTLMKSDAPFFCTDLIYMIYLYFSVVCLSIIMRNVLKKLHLQRRDISLYIKHVVTRTKFTSFRPSKLVTFTLLTAKENLYMNFLRTIFSSLVNKNFNYIVILFLCYVFSFVSKDFVLPSYVEVSMNSKSERIFSNKKKIPEDFSKHIVSDEKI